MRRHSIVIRLQMMLKRLRVQTLLSKPFCQKFLRGYPRSTRNQFYPLPHQVEALRNLRLVITRFYVEGFRFRRPLTYEVKTWMKLPHGPEGGCGYVFAPFYVYTFSFQFLKNLRVCDSLERQFRHLQSVF